METLSRAEKSRTTRNFRYILRVQIMLALILSLRRPTIIKKHELAIRKRTEAEPEPLPQLVNTEQRMKNWVEETRSVISQRKAFLSFGNL